MHLVNLRRRLYLQQKACVRTGYGPRDWFHSTKGVRQGCIVSPILFSIYSEVIRRIALANHSGKVFIGGRKVSNLRYADDIVLFAESEEEMQSQVNDIHRVSLDFGLVLHPGKAVAMLIDRSVSLPTPKIIKTVNKFCYLGYAL